MTPERYERVMALFHAASELAPEEGAAFLAEACAGDVALRREVEELLAAGEQPHGLLDEGLAELESTVTAAKAAWAWCSVRTTPSSTGRWRSSFLLAMWPVRRRGGTLKNWVKAEPRTWRQVVELLVGVADGLATAHAAGILHRDIKPGNILLHASEYAKLADFGLAKLAQALTPAGKRKLAEGPTRPGAVIGTIPYMSPEQASGKELDARSDVFSFGTVLYEAVAGRRPFTGATDLETLQEILHGTPKPLGEEAPPALRGVIEKALEKDPADRYQSMREMVVDLRRLVRQSVEAPAVVMKRTPRRWIWAAVLPLVPIAGFLAWQAWRTPKSVEPLRAVPLTAEPGVHRYPTFSPDGNHVAYTWAGPRQDNPDVYVQLIGSGSPLRLTKDPGNDYSPAWSPDGRSIAFLRSQAEAGGSELVLIPPLGGPERRLAEIRVRGGTYISPPFLAWCPDSSCLVVTESPGEGKPDALYEVSIETGEKRQLTHPQAPASGDSNPAVSHDGKWLVFRRQLALFSGELYLLPLGKSPAAAEPRSLTLATLDARHPTWMPNGKEILFSVRGGLRRLALGESTSARLPYVGEDGIMPVVSKPQPGRPPRLVYVRSFVDENIWRVETSAPGAPASLPPAIFISSTRGEWFPQFSPDGRRVAFASDRSGEGGVWLADADGSSTIQLASMGSFATGGLRWSPDGERIVFHSSPEGQPEIFLVPVVGGKPRNLTAHPAGDSFPSFSRDGKWVYFSSNRSGKDRLIWKIPASGGEAVQVTNSVGNVPLESPDGAYLYYVPTIDKPSPLWRVPVSGGVPVKVLEGVVLGNYLVREEGIYYIDRPAGQGGVHYLDNPSGETRLQYCDFATRRSKTVARNLGKVGVYLTVSPDGRTILYSRIDSSVDDLMLVENFR